MHLAVERGVPQEERQKVALGSLTDWDAARIFLEVVRCGSFRSAAERLSLSINAVRRRIGDFERQIGATLFTRDVHGARLTDEGSLVVAAVERMEAAAFDLLRASDSVANTLSGEVRVAVTEGLGTFWLAPRLVEFRQSFPNILVDLYCAMRSADVSRHEADVAIHLSRPSTLDVKMVRLGRMHLMSFAAQNYIDIHGSPRTVADMVNHRMVLQVGEEAATKEAFESLFSRFRPARHRGDEDQCLKRQLLGGRQRRGHRRVSHLCLRTRRENGAARSRATLVIRYMAVLSSRQWSHPKGAAHDRLAGGSLQSRKIPVVQG